jgi:hypothetical protein
MNAGRFSNPATSSLFCDTVIKMTFEMITELPFKLAFKLSVRLSQIAEIRCLFLTMLQRNKKGRADEHERGPRRRRQARGLDCPLAVLTKMSREETTKQPTMRLYRVKRVGEVAT